MIQRSFFVSFFAFLLLAGCGKNTEVTESASPLETHGAIGANAPESLPFPDAKELETLGSLNDLDTQWLLSNPVFVAAGQPRRFLTSPLGQGNAEIINSVLSQFLQTPLNYNDVESFIFGVNTPIEAVVEVMERGVRIPRTVPLNRRTTVLTFVAPIKPKDFFDRFFVAPQPIEEIPRQKIGSREVFDLTPPNLAVPQKLVLFFAGDRTVVLVEGDEPAIQEAFNDRPPRGAAIERVRRTDIANSDLVLVASREGVPFTVAEIQFLLQQNGVPEGLANALASGARAVTIRVDVLAEVGQPMFVANITMTTPKVAEEVSETFLGYLITAQTGLMSTTDGNEGTSPPIFAGFALSLLNSLTIDTVGHRVDTVLSKFADFDTVAAKGVSDAQAQFLETQRQQRRFEQLAVLARVFVAHYQRNQKFPTSILAEDGTPLLSWRVALLPTIGQNELYKKFKLDEPWDAPTNKPLLEEMPSIFAAGELVTEKNKTILRYFDSEGTPFANKNLKAEDLKAPQTTVLLVNVAPEKAIEWTKPDAMEFDAQKLEETVGNVFFGVSFAGQPVILPIIPLSDPRSVFQREHITARVKDQLLPQAPTTPLPAMPSPAKEEDTNETPE